jgi:hypothetical protein
VLSIVRYKSLRRADHSSRVFLPSVVCLSVIELPEGRVDRGPLRGCWAVEAKSLKQTPSWGTKSESAKMELLTLYEALVKDPAP